jgi:hypothetical protein
MGKHSTRVDVAKNRLYLNLSGMLTDDEMQAHCEQEMRGVDRLRPGFIIIVDFKDFKPATPEGYKRIAEGAKYAAGKGLKAVIQIQPTDAIGGMQSGRVARESGVSGDMRLVASLEEAEKLADTL